MIKTIKKLFSKVIKKLFSLCTHDLERKIDMMNKNMNFLINNSLEINQIQTKPSVKAIQIEIYELLEKLDLFLKAKGLDYFLFAGSLLGSVRHKGFIPWDDDIDVGMIRDDFNKLLEYENEFADFGLYFSSPYSSFKNYNKGGWHRIYSDNTKFTLSIFLFDLVQTENITDFLNSRKKYQSKAFALSQRCGEGKLSVSDFKRNLDELNQKHFLKARIIDKKSAGRSTYIVKSITSTSRQIFIPYNSVFPLSKGEFNVMPNQKTNLFPIPNSPEVLFENFYGKDYMFFPMDLYPRHFK